MDLGMLFPPVLSGMLPGISICKERTQSRICGGLDQWCRKTFAHPILLFLFSPGLLGGPSDRGSSSFHPLQLHPLPTVQNLLGETCHLQGLGARGGLGRARGPPAAVGGAALTADPAEGDVREGVAEPPQAKRGAGEKSDIHFGDSTHSAGHFTSRLSPFSFCWGG